MVVSGEIRGVEEAELKGLSGDWKIRLVRQRLGLFQIMGGEQEARLSLGIADSWGLIPLPIQRLRPWPWEDTGTAFRFLDFPGRVWEEQKGLIPPDSGKLKMQKQ